MAHRYRVYPVPTINLPALHPGVRFHCYELYLGDGEALDVRTRRVELNEPEIILAQIVDLDGQVVRRSPG
jgi:hypothetical protein